MNDYKELIGDIEDCLIAQPSEAVCKRLLREAADAIEQLVKERDAAVADLQEYCDCDVCRNNNDECLNNGLCKKCSVGKSTRRYWEWRGLEDNDEIN